MPPAFSHPPSQTDVLIVCDSAETRLRLSEPLSRQGYRVRSQGSSVRSFTEIRDFPPDLLLLDLCEDRTRGFVFLKALFGSVPDYRGAVVLVADPAPSLLEEETDGYRIQYLLTRPFLDEELLLLVAAAIRSLKLELAAVNFEKQMEEDLLLAASVQQSLLPLPPPAPPGITIAATYRPSHRLGGDYFDVIDLGEGETGLFLGDVAGHGISAALFPAVLSAHLSQTVVRSQRKNPEDTLAALNTTLAPMFDGLGRFVTAVYATFSPDRDELLYSIAGHPDPLLVRADGSVERLEVGGVPLGIEPDASYRRAGVPFGSGDRVFFFSDGAFEQAWHGKGLAFGKEQFERALIETRSPSLRADLEQIVEMIVEWAGAEGLTDDVSLLAIERLEPGAS